MNTKKFYVNLFSGCWLTDGEMKHLLNGREYELLHETSCHNDCYRIVFNDR